MESAEKNNAVGGFFFRIIYYSRSRVFLKFLNILAGKKKRLSNICDEETAKIIIIIRQGVWIYETPGYNIIIANSGAFTRMFQKKKTETLRAKTVGIELKILSDVTSTYR